MIIRHPGDLIRVPFGNNYRTLVYERRKREWMKVKERFRETPKTIRGLKIYLNPDDLSPVGVSIGTTGWLNLALTSLALNLAKPGMKVVDVGANIGYYTLLFQPGRPVWISRIVRARAAELFLPQEVC